MLIERLSHIGSNATPDPAASGDKHLIGDLEQYVGMEPKTIRFYERAGLIAPQRLGRFRVYDNSDIQRLMLIKYLRSIGMPLAKIRTIIAANGADKNDSEIHRLLREQLSELRRRQVELQKSIDTLTQLLPASGASNA